MCTRADCEKFVGQWVRFRTPYGEHMGLLERVTPRAAIVLSPRQYVPAQWAQAPSLPDGEAARLDAVLAWGAPGAFGYGAGWGWGWQRWAVSFLIIYALWGLLWW
ncbi:MAG: hypothetical protein K6T31_02005 [Alicyclobacillus sp.]|nr:hypothetical protein [Alicyclobacillus sp.]